MAYITTTADSVTLHETRFDDDKKGNLTVYGISLTTDSRGNGTMKATNLVLKILARDEVTLSTVTTEDDFSLITEQVAKLQVEAERISASVSETRTSTSEAVADLYKRVEASMTAEDVELKISNAVDNGVSQVSTTTGFTFNQDGLNISKSTSDISTTITEDGMRVERKGEEVLRADNEGVKAEDLHATTYLIIGNNSRFEDYKKNNEDRTACFWIGPTSN